MSAALVRFVFDGEREVRTVLINCEPRFNVGDLCAILEIQNPRDVVAKNLRKDDVAKIYVTIADGRRRQVWFTIHPRIKGSQRAIHLIDRSSLIFFVENFAELYADRTKEQAAPRRELIRKEALP
jgi:hypothetical protein